MIAVFAHDEVLSCFALGQIETKIFLPAGIVEISFYFMHGFFLPSIFQQSRSEGR